MSARLFDAARPSGRVLPASEQPGYRLFADFPDLLAVEHLAAITGLSRQTIRGEINAGRLPAQGL